MLAIGSGLAPYYRAGSIIHKIPVSVSMFSIAFHIALLEISRKTMHVLIIRENGFRLGAKEIDIPNTDHRHQNRNILFKGCFAEMIVCFVSSLQEQFKIFISYCEGN